MNLSVRFAENHDLRDYGGARGPSGFNPIIGTITVDGGLAEFRGFHEGVDIVRHAGDGVECLSVVSNGSWSLERIMTLVAQMKSVETTGSLKSLGFGEWMTY